MKRSDNNFLNSGQNIKNSQINRYGSYKWQEQVIKSSLKFTKK